MKGQAVKPDFFQKLPTFIKEKEVTREDITDEEKYLYNLKSNAGWKVIKEYSESLLRDLDQVTDLSLSQGLSLEEIGKNAIVANLAKGIIKRILNKVEDAEQVKNGQQQ